MTIPDLIAWLKNLKNNLGEEMKLKMKEMEEKIVIAQEEYDKRKNKKNQTLPSTLHLTENSILNLLGNYLKKN